MTTNNGFVYKLAKRLFLFWYYETVCNPHDNSKW